MITGRRRMQPRIKLIGNCWLTPGLLRRATSFGAERRWRFERSDKRRLIGAGLIAVQCAGHQRLAVVAVSVWIESPAPVIGSIFDMPFWNWCAMTPAGI